VLPIGSGGKIRYFFFVPALCRREINNDHYARRRSDRNPIREPYVRGHQSDVTRFVSDVPSMNFDATTIAVDVAF